MSELMKAVVLNGANDFETKEVKIPEISNEEILLKMENATICGTDVRILEGRKTKDVRYPSIIGHEFAGIIEKVGKDVQDFSVGDRVSVAPVVPCHNCSSCLIGRENACLNRQAMGYEFDGGFAEYVRLPKVLIDAGNVIKLNPDISFTAGALIEPLSCCIRGFKNVGTKFNDTVLIIGAGPIGLMHIQISKLAGARKVIVSEPNESRREVALELGADVVVNPVEQDLDSIVYTATGGLGCERVILCIGVTAIVDGAIKLCKRGGSVCLFAGFNGDGESSISANKIHYNEVYVCGSTAFSKSDYLLAADLVGSRRINMDAIVTHTYSLDDFKDAYDMAVSGQGLKIAIKP